MRSMCITAARWQGRPGLYTAPMPSAPDGCLPVVRVGALVLGLEQRGRRHGFPGLDAPFGTNWPMYHQNLLSSGVDPVNTDLTP